MKIVEDYLRKELGLSSLANWEEIRGGYVKRACKLVEADYQAPSFAASLTPQAGRRVGKIWANMTDYTRDQHDLAISYEKKFAREYLPKMGVWPITPYVTNSGMAALTTIAAMLHRVHGVEQTIMVGEHSYFQNRELLQNSFAKVIAFDEGDIAEWTGLIEKEKPLAIFVDTLCNVSELVVPPIEKIAREYKSIKGPKYLVIDNSLLGYGFPWQNVLRYKTKDMTIIGWESLNKYYQFGLDRTMGGIVWASNEKTSIEIFYARMHCGSILSDIQTALLPTPNRRIMKKYLARIQNNGSYLAKFLTNKIDNKVAVIKRAETGYGFDGAQIVVRHQTTKSYLNLRGVINKIIKSAKKEGVQIVAGSSFGLHNTRIYVTARKTDYAQMFLRIAVGTEEREQIEKIAKVIASSL